MVGAASACVGSRKSYRRPGAQGVKNLTTISTNVGVDDFDLANAFTPDRSKRTSAAMSARKPPARATGAHHKIDLTWFPQEHSPSAARPAARVFGVLTPTGVGTMVAEGKRRESSDGRTYVMERGLDADFAADQSMEGRQVGELIYRKNRAQFQAYDAMAAKITIAEVEAPGWNRVSSMGIT